MRTGPASPARTSRRLRRLAGPAAAAASLALLAACGGGSSGTAAAPLADSVAAACDTGGTPVTIQYWSTANPNFPQESAPFTTKYPSITVTMTEVDSSVIAQKLLLESQSGQTLSADAIDSDVASLLPLITKGIVAPVQWASLGLPSTQLTALGNGAGARTYRDPVGLAYNTKLVGPGDLPTTYDQLADPKYAGQIVYDPRGTYFQNLGAAWGPERAQTFYDKLTSAAKPVPVRGSTASLQRVASGQSRMSTSALADGTQQLIDNGAPMKLQYLDVVPTLDHYYFVTKGSANANAAACFGAWWAGPEGTAQRVKFEGKPNADVPADMPATSKVVPLDTEQQIADASTMAAYVAKHSAS